MHEFSDTSVLISMFVVLAVALLTVSLSKRMGLGIILGYLIAGIAISPWEQEIFRDSEHIRFIGEFGVVLLLFIIGLELTPSRLWKLRLGIFGLGFAQVALCGTLFSLVGVWLGFDWIPAIIGGGALALSSTAFSIQLLQERGQLRSTYGQKTFSILLLQDLCIIPLLALVAAAGSGTADPITPVPSAFYVIEIISAICLLIATGHYLLPYMFTLLSRLVEIHDVMLLGALFTAVGSAMLMQIVGLNMTLGAFLAGVTLAESSYKHQLVANIEPFRSFLLGLFFISVGVSIDVSGLLQNWSLILLSLIAILSIKILSTWLVTRLFRISNADGLRIAVTISQIGEFSLVISKAANEAGIFSPFFSDMIVIIAILSMAATPLLRIILDALADILTKRGITKETLESFKETDAKVIIVGFGRFGQILSEMLAADGIKITVIESNTETLEKARSLGYRAIYGDITNPLLLETAGASNATLIAFCFKNRFAMEKAIDVARTNFPHLAIFCRSNDGYHAAELRNKKIDFEIQDTFESAISFGKETLTYLGLPHERINDIEQDTRNLEYQNISRHMKKVAT